MLICTIFFKHVVIVLWSGAHVMLRQASQITVRNYVREQIHVHQREQYKESVLVNPVQVSEVLLYMPLIINTPRPKQNGQYFAGDFFKYIFLNENV